MKRVILLLILTLFTYTFTVYGQERIISGKVTSQEDGSGLPGVSIQLKGTTTGAITDVEGDYKVSIPSGDAILIYSFIGMRTYEMPVGSQSVIDIVMESDMVTLSEIIVSGVAGGTPREKLTVSVTKVDAATLNAVPATSVSRSLSGKVSGVRISNSNGTPGGGSDIQLRSDNNLGVGSSPLVIMDGIILEGGLADINADDIQSIEVVRGASASSLYGSRAGNGVIVVTSQRGKKQAVGTTFVTIRNEVGIQELERTIDLATHHSFELASDWETAKGQYTKFAGVTYPSGYVGGYSRSIVGNRTLDPDHYMDNEFGLVKDHQRALFQQGINSVNFISVATRNQTSNLYASLERNLQEGIIKNTDGYTRNSFRLNFDHNINDWLTLTASNMFINTTSNFTGGGGGIFFDIVLAEPDNNLDIAHPDGQPYYIRHNQWSNETNPLYATWKNKRDAKTRRTLMNYTLKAEATDWLNFEASYSGELINYRYTSLNPKDTWRLDNSASNDQQISYSDGSLYKYSDERFSQTAQLTANLNKRIGDLIIRGKLSYLWESNVFERYDASGFGLGQLGVPQFSNIPTDNISASSQTTQTEAENYFAIAGLDYKDKILVDGLYRLDKSSLFGPDSRTNGYYRISGAYRISQDVDIPGIQELKIRAARGTAGQRPGFFYRYETFSSSNGTGTPSQLGNVNLKPSNTAETEVALNVSFLDMFTLETIYSMSTTTDQFLNVPLLPTAGGFSNQWQNAGTVEASTFEINLGAKIVDNKDLQWNAGATFTTTQQTITELPIAPFQSGPDGLWFIKEGEIYGSIYGYDWVRSLEQMQAQLGSGESISDYAMNSEGYVIKAGTEGTVNEAAIYLRDEDGNRDFKQIGDGNPDFYMGIRNTVSYKGLSLYVLLDWKQGGDVYNRKAQWLTRDDRLGILDQSGVAEGSKKAFDYYKQFYDVNSNNSYWVEDAGYLKIREASIGYKVPKAILGGFAKGAIKNADLKFIGRNLITFTGYSGYDPEVGSIRNPFDGTGTYPNFRNYAVSLTLQF